MTSLPILRRLVRDFPDDGRIERHLTTFRAPPQSNLPSHFSIHGAPCRALNPLKMILIDIIDFDRLKTAEAAPSLFISATNVRTGKIKIFDKSSPSLEAVLASACLPQLFPAVEIDGEYYWDGGYMGNPAIFPLI